MVELTIDVESVDAPAHAASPLLVFKLAVSAESVGDAAPDEPRVQWAALRCQVMIASTRRRYTPAEQAALRDLFGDPAEWSRSLRPLLLGHASTVLPPFTARTVAELPFACTYDMDVASCRYVNALQDGRVPLQLQFSGGMCILGADGTERLCPVSQSLEARHELPVASWRRAMDLHFPNSAWIRISRPVLDRLVAHRGRCRVPTWDAAVESLLESTREGRS